MKKIIQGLIVAYPILLFLRCGNLLTDSPKSGTKEITSFSLSSPDTTAIIVDSTRTINVDVPFGTPVTALTPTITHTGVAIDPVSGAARDFSSPVAYTVTADDGSTRIYTVTVLVGPDTAKAITSFKLSGPDITAVIVDSARTINVDVPFGTPVTALTPTITHTGVAIDPVSGAARDFSSPVVYTVTADDGSTRIYTLMVLIRPDTAKAITSFKLSSPETTATIVGLTHTIIINVPFRTLINALTPTITHTGVAVDPPSGVARDFSNSVTYTVTAADGSTRAYTAVAIVGLDTAKSVTSFRLSSPDTAGIIIDSTRTITVKVPFGTPVTALIPAFAHTGVAVDPPSGAARDFSNPVTYTVTAADGSTRAYTAVAIVGLDTAKTITSFSLSSPDTAGIIIDSTGAITVHVPFGTAVTSLTPSITHTGAAIDPDTGAARDFSSPVAYTVTAADGSIRSYTVTVLVGLDTAKAVTSFKLSPPDTSAIIVDSTGAITVHVPFGTAVTSLTPSITHTGAAIDPDTGAARDFTNPVTYTVIAADGTKRFYTVTVIVAPDTAKEITSFHLSCPEVTGAIDDLKHLITVYVPFGTAVTSLAPTITHTGASIIPLSSSVQDFSSPVTYTVTAADGSTLSYTVSVKIANALPTKLKILFVGNSITHHEPSPELGWYGDWGMAASSKENDYVHILISKLSDCFLSTSFAYQEETVVSWENNFSTSLYVFQDIINYCPDICIVRLGENVDEEYAKNNNYYSELTKLITFCIDSSTKVIVTGNFHPSFYKDSIQQSVALDNGWHYVDFKHIGADPANYAYGLFSDPAVASHPSDAGMKEMALSIYYKIQEILFNQ